MTLRIDVPGSYGHVKSGREVFRTSMFLLEERAGSLIESAMAGFVRRWLDVQY